MQSSQALLVTSKWSALWQEQPSISSILQIIPALPNKQRQFEEFVLLFKQKLPASPWWNVFFCQVSTTCIAHLVICKRDLFHTPSVHSYYYQVIFCAVFFNQTEKQIFYRVQTVTCYSLHCVMISIYETIKVVSKVFATVWSYLPGTTSLALLIPLSTVQQSDRHELEMLCYKSSLQNLSKEKALQGSLSFWKIPDILLGTCVFCKVKFGHLSADFPWKLRIK